MSETKTCPICGSSWTVPDRYYSGPESPRAWRNCSCEIAPPISLSHTDTVVTELLERVNNLTGAVNGLLRLIPSATPNPSSASTPKAPYAGLDLNYTSLKVPRFILQAMIANGDAKFRGQNRAGMDLKYMGCLYCGESWLASESKPAGPVPVSLVTGFDTCFECVSMKSQQPEVMNWMTRSLLFLYQAFDRESSVEIPEQRNILI